LIDSSPEHRLAFGEGEGLGSRGVWSRRGTRRKGLLAEDVGVLGSKAVDEGKGIAEEGDKTTSDVEVDELAEVVSKEGEDGGERRFSHVE
jgi:hypothetical protein